MAFTLIPRSLLFSLITPLQCGTGNEIHFQLSLLDFFSYFNALLSLPPPPWQGTIQSRRLGLSRLGLTRQFSKKLGGVSFASCYPGLNPVRTLIVFWTHWGRIPLIPFTSCPRLEGRHHRTHSLIIVNDRMVISVEPILRVFINEPSPSFD